MVVFLKFKNFIIPLLQFDFIYAILWLVKEQIMRNLTPMQIKNLEVSAFGCGYYFCIGANMIV